MTALRQIVIAFGGSVALLADPAHDFADTPTPTPLWLAFALRRRVAVRRYTYGYGQGKDLAGIVIVDVIVSGALLSVYQAQSRVLDPKPLQHAGRVIVEAIVGSGHNETVARCRVGVGREIGAALVADGQHA